MSKLVPLASAVEFIRGITFKPEDVIGPGDDDAVVCMRTKNIQSVLDTSDLIAVPSRFVRRKELFLKPSDMLISSANSWNLVGKTVYVGELNYPATAGGFISIVRPRPNIIDSRYLYRWIMHPRTQEAIRNCGRQTTNISNLSVERFLNLDIPLPKLDEQRRIAAILDKADAIRKKRRDALMLADEFLRSAFLGLFGDPVTNSKRLPEKPIAELATVTTGNTPSREIDAYFGDHIEWIKSDNINTPFHFLTKSTEGLSESGLKVARSAPAGSTLITCIAGSPSCIGNAALADRKVSFNQQINALTPKPGIEPEFIYAATLFSKPRIQAASTNGMKGMVSKGALEQVRFILPPQDQRRKFVEIFQKVMALRLKLDNAALEADALYGSLAQRAFQGKL